MIAELWKEWGFRKGIMRGFWVYYLSQTLFFLKTLISFEGFQGWWFERIWISINSGDRRTRDSCICRFLCWLWGYQTKLSTLPLWIWWSTNSTFSPTDSLPTNLGHFDEWSSGRDRILDILLSSRCESFDSFCLEVISQYLKTCLIFTIFPFFISSSLSFWLSLFFFFLFFSTTTDGILL